MLSFRLPVQVSCAPEDVFKVWDQEALKQLAWQIASEMCTLVFQYPQSQNAEF